MFDRFVVAPARDQHHHHRTEVHEHRAPTDDSVKLLREMEQAALDKILGSIRLEGCPVDCVVFHMRDHLSDRHKFIVRYKLGRHERELRTEYQPSHVLHGDELRLDAVNHVRDALAKDIATGLLAEPMNKLMFGKFPQFP